MDLCNTTTACMYSHVHVYMYVYTYTCPSDTHTDVCMCMCIYVCIRARTLDTEIPTIIDPSATINYPSPTRSIIVGISVSEHEYKICIFTILLLAQSSFLLLSTLVLCRNLNIRFYIL